MNCFRRTLRIQRITNVEREGSRLVTFDIYQRAIERELNFDHRRTQDFIMEGVHVVGAGPWGLGTEVPQWGPGQSPGRGSGVESPAEAEAKDEISVQFLTLFCIKFRI